MKNTYILKESLKVEDESLHGYNFKAVTHKCIKDNTNQNEIENTKIRSVTSNLTFKVAALLSEPTLPIPQLLLRIWFGL